MSCTAMRTFRLFRDADSTTSAEVYLRCQRSEGHDGQHVHPFAKWRDNHAQLAASDQTLSEYEAVLLVQASIAASRSGPGVLLSTAERIIAARATS